MVDYQRIFLISIPLNESNNVSLILQIKLSIKVPFCPLNLVGGGGSDFREKNLFDMILSKKSLKLSQNAEITFMLIYYGFKLVIVIVGRMFDNL